MAQDYAKYRGKNAAHGARRAAATRMSPPASTHWNWYVAGVLSGLFAVFVGYIGIANFGAETPSEAPVAQVVVAQDDLPVFSFYQDLANARVDVSAPVTTTPAATPTAPAQSTQNNPATTQATNANAQNAATPPAATVATAATSSSTASSTAPAAASAASDTRQYLLQAGSFQNRQDAESRRARILLLNLNASVVPGVVSGRTWQRVQVGPFNGRQSAEAARTLLAENNIDSIPLIVR
ncbi:MAG: SPOR domain-containing protein [Pseudomonadales bacterium]|jgi:cell division protein FtsN|nr:SPOR domain-containing protein [Pseudomonadales bacterium]